jgi:hypothetical protein
LVGHGGECGLEVRFHDLQFFLDPFHVMWSQAFFLLPCDVTVDFVDRGLVLFGLVQDLLQGFGQGEELLLQVGC